MFTSQAVPASFHHRKARTSRFFALITLFASISFAASAQFAQPTGTKVQDASALRPPAGARVAIVEFADLECPACAHANPLLKQAAAKYNIPWVRHDLVIPGHVWSPIAAVNARWFDSKSKALGDAYRDDVFANQNSIYNPGVLNQFTQKFAQNHGVVLPFNIDPQGKLNAEVRADTELGRRTGVVRTPTIFIVTANSKGAPYIEVQNVDRDLYQDIDQALAGTKNAAPAAHRAASK